MYPYEKVQSYLEKFNMNLQIIDLDENTSTAPMAAAALGVKVGQIAKSLLFKVGEGYVMVIAPGDVKIKQGRLKAAAGGKAKLAAPDEVEKVTGYSIGGVCPFGLSSPVRIFLEKSLGDYDIVYAAAGTPHSALPITLEQLQLVTGGEIVDLCGDTGK